MADSTTFQTHYREAEFALFSNLGTFLSEGAHLVIVYGTRLDTLLVKPTQESNCETNPFATLLMKPTQESNFGTN